MAESTARWGWPNLMAGQAQKEVTHNEALAMIDGLLHPVAETTALSSPPSDPAVGRLWLVGTDAAGAWAGQDGRIALWTEGGWRFVTPTPAMTVWIADAGLWAQWNGSHWEEGVLSVRAVRCAGVQVVGAQQPPIPPAAGGTVVDHQARDTLSAVLDAMRNHGLIAT